ncbi:MAG: putative Mitogen-activated protein kinase 15 [Streblomastix strix]|uniref:Putative Mitogen-activated protein kinase 15 n=1 Tax=Streblomastix strix TaxID=222440 RepID=A0A5J4V6F5_9EUKA|nr:MAG: putative Mitogen-activated protein kinase 15 [Streblomastix strix]
MFLSELGRHENIVHLTNVIKSDNIKDIYLVFEYSETDLHVVIRSNILEPIHKQFIMYQSFKALKYMHSAGLLHRDLKPSNIFLNSECVIKVGDFGLARLMGTKEGMGQQNTLLTDYVATRWYRAPEILLGSQKYTKGVDMWSMGCILGEMLGGKPMFPGSSTSNQLQKVLEVTGYPSPEDIDSLQSPYAKNMLESVQSTVSGTAKSLGDLYPGSPADALDMLSQLLQFNPNKRPTAEQALEHPFLAQFHNIEEEPVCEKKIVIGLDDNVKMSINTYRDTLYKFIRQQREKSRHRHGSGSQISPSTSQTNIAASAQPQPGGEKEKERTRDGAGKDDPNAQHQGGTHHQPKQGVSQSIQPNAEIQKPAPGPANVTSPPNAQGQSKQIVKPANPNQQQGQQGQVKRTAPAQPAKPDGQK